MDFYYDWPHSNQVYNYDYNLGGYFNNSSSANAPNTPNASTRVVPTTTNPPAAANNYYNPYQQAPAANYYSYEKNPVSYVPTVQQPEQTLPSFDSYANVASNWTTSTGPTPALNVNQVPNYNMHLQPPMQIPTTSQTAPIVTSSGDQNLWSAPLDNSNYTVQSYYDAYAGYSLPLKQANSRNIGSGAIYPEQPSYFSQPTAQAQNEYNRYSAKASMPVELPPIPIGNSSQKDLAGLYEKHNIYSSLNLITNANANNNSSNGIYSQNYGLLQQQQQQPYIYSSHPSNINTIPAVKNNGPLGKSNIAPIRTVLSAENITDFASKRAYGSEDRFYSKNVSEKKFNTAFNMQNSFDGPRNQNSFMKIIQRAFSESSFTTTSLNTSSSGLTISTKEGNNNAEANFRNKGLAGRACSGLSCANQNRSVENIRWEDFKNNGIPPSFRVHDKPLYSDLNKKSLNSNYLNTSNNVNNTNNSMNIMNQSSINNSVVNPNMSMLNNNNNNNPNTGVNAINNPPNPYNIAQAPPVGIYSRYFPTSAFYASINVPIPSKQIINQAPPPPTTQAPPATQPHLMPSNTTQNINQSFQAQANQQQQQNGKYFPSNQAKPKPKDNNAKHQNNTNPNMGLGSQLNLKKSENNLNLKTNKAKELDKKLNDSQPRASNVSSASKDKEVKRSNGPPVFIPPDPEQLMRPTLRGPPTALIQNFNLLSKKLLSNTSSEKLSAKSDSRPGSSNMPQKSSSNVFMKTNIKENIKVLKPAESSKNLKRDKSAEPQPHQHNHYHHHHNHSHQSKEKEKIKTTAVNAKTQTEKSKTPDKQPSGHHHHHHGSHHHHHHHHHHQKNKASPDAELKEQTKQSCNNIRPTNSPIPNLNAKATNQSCVELQKNSGKLIIREKKKHTIIVNQPQPPTKFLPANNNVNAKSCQATNTSANGKNNNGKNRSESSVSTYKLSDASITTSSSESISIPNRHVELNYKHQRQIVINRKNSKPALNTTSITTVNASTNTMAYCGKQSVQNSSTQTTTNANQLNKREVQVINGQLNYPRQASSNQLVKNQSKQTSDKYIIKENLSKNSSEFNPPCRFNQSSQCDKAKKVSSNQSRNNNMSNKKVNVKEKVATNIDQQIFGPSERALRQSETKTDLTDLRKQSNNALFISSSSALSYLESNEHNDQYGHQTGSNANIQNNYSGNYNSGTSASTAFNHASNKAYKKGRAVEKAFSVVNSILDVPLPSDNDAFSEYSTFVNNIFSKALEK